MPDPDEHSDDSGGRPDDAGEGEGPPEDVPPGPPEDPPGSGEPPQPPPGRKVG